MLFCTIALVDMFLTIPEKAHGELGQSTKLVHACVKNCLYCEGFPLPISNSIAAVSDFPMDAFTSISFTHHMEIIRKAKTFDERLFYIRECASGHWSKVALRARLKEDLYNHQGSLPNNFSMTMSNDKQYVKAIQMFKDEYFLDFINTEELDLSDPEDLDERVLEKEIIDHIRNFIQFLGSGFCFVGNQHRLCNYRGRQKL